MDITPNPRNCSACEHAFGGQGCTAPLPSWVPKELKRKVDDPTAVCDAYKPPKGVFKRICLNCGHPIRTHHKYSSLGDKQWVHKYCDQPESPSKWHHERYGS